MKNYNDRVLKISVLVIYVLAFYGLWTVWELWGRSFISTWVQNEYISQFIKSGVIKNTVWTLPAIILIRHFEADMNVGLKEMFTTRVQFIKYLPIYALLTVYLLAGAVLQKGRIAISETFGSSDLIIVLFVGITEEMVFRGWLLNATMGEKNWIPVIINSIMFLFIHFPNWIHAGIFIENFLNLSFLSPVILGVIFGWTFIKSKNILIPISLHMYWDLLMFLLY